MDFILFPYNQIMEGPLSTSPTKLLCEHMEAKRTALEAFKTSSSYGTNFVSTNSKSLERDIDEKFAYYRELNESKKLGKRLKATLEQLSDNEMYRLDKFLNFSSQSLINACTANLRKCGRLYHNPAHLKIENNRNDYKPQHSHTCVHFDKVAFALLI